MKNLNFVAGMTRRFVSAKRLIRYFSNSSKLVEHRAQISEMQRKLRIYFLVTGELYILQYLFADV